MFRGIEKEEETRKRREKAEANILMSNLISGAHGWITGNSIFMNSLIYGLCP